MAAERDIASGLGGGQALVRFEPLAPAPDQRQQREGRAEQVLGRPGDALETRLGCAV
jgi:hypothetical protein